MKLLCLLLVLAFPCLAFAQAEVARVKMLRGEANMKLNGKSTPLAVDQAVISGSVVETSDKSFVRLVFTDKSQMNIGPNSEMEIKRFGGDDAGVIDLVKGRIRSQVTKDYLQQKDKDKSKLFIKTPNAVMGVRGTDFMIATNGETTSTVLFEGEIVFNRLDAGAGTELTTDKLEAIVSGPGTARMQPGEFFVQRPGDPQPTVPSVLNVQQKETLESNVDFSTTRAPSQNTEASNNSVVPPGLSGEAAANQPDALKSEIAQLVDTAAAAPAAKPNAALASGFEQNGVVKPTNGSFLHVESGVVIPPPKNSVYDANSNSFIPAGGGQVTADGSYQPPKNVTITDGGKILVQNGNQVVEVKSTSAVMGRGATLGDVMKAVNSVSTGGGAQGPTATVAAAAQQAVAAAAPVNRTGTLLPPNLPVREAPTLCSTCGGAIPGSAATTTNMTNVIFLPTTNP